MITRIGVIYEDRTSFGFLLGLRDRLKCVAEFVRPPAAMPRGPRISRRAARHAWNHFQKQGVHLVVRFTDADRDRWQDVRRDELDVVPDQGKSVWICGVAVNNVEEWLCLDQNHLTRVLGITPENLNDPEHRTGSIKSALARLSAERGKDRSDVVARIVRDAPHEVSRKWLADDALHRFYSDCRAAAAAADCDTPNEFETGDDE